MLTTCIYTNICMTRGYMHVSVALACKSDFNQHKITQHCMNSEEVNSRKHACIYALGVRVDIHD